MSINFEINIQSLSSMPILILKLKQKEELYRRTQNCIITI